ncbi:MAG: GNAT family N-acetyltransferase [Flavobacteriales bacterium]|nr:GNAT family N-acetyltransferase [Flavobacteriales bacterium]
MSGIRVTEANGEWLQAAEQVLRGFLPHQRAHYAANIATVERYFDEAAHDRELADLHAHYGPPDGCVLLALDGEDPAGVVCLRRFDMERCEMKRLFVPRDHRRKGIGRILSLALIDHARMIGYKKMVLDTGTFMVESQALYTSMGFRYVDPYYAVRDELRNDLVYMELTL